MSPEYNPPVSALLLVYSTPWGSITSVRCIEGGNDQLSQPPAHLHVVQAAELEPLVRLLVKLDGDAALAP